VLAGLCSQQTVEDSGGLLGVVDGHDENSAIA
jgi:hypothetical protein